MHDTPFFVALHIGAGTHLAKNDVIKKKVMSEACKRAATALQAGKSAMEACQSATIALEDHASTNAGFGSTLTEKGTVECDASIMDGDGLFGAVGACSGLQNPIEVAYRIAEESHHPMPLHRVRPLFLAGDGAREWAAQRGLRVAISAEEAKKWNISAAQRKLWTQYSAMLAHSKPAWETGSGEQEKMEQGRGRQIKRCNFEGTAKLQDMPQKLAKNADGAEGKSEYMYDTVGCICMDSQGKVAAAVSSGGITMKSCGRVGEAAMYGCGCWASNLSSGKKSRAGVACSVTGVGENIVRSLLARSICNETHTSEDELDEVCRAQIQSLVLDMSLPVRDTPKDCGLVIMKVAKDARLLVNFVMAFSSPSIGFAYFHSDMTDPVCKFERIQSYARDENQIACFGTNAVL